LLQPDAWDQEKDYCADPPTCIRYTIVWKVKVNNTVDSRYSDMVRRRCLYRYIATTVDSPYNRDRYNESRLYHNAQAENGRSDKSHGRCYRRPTITTTLPETGAQRDRPWGNHICQWRTAARPGRSPPSFDHVTFLFNIDITCRTVQSDV
jgi:hypothetical protein